MPPTQLAGLITIRAYGTPVPQGSKTASVIRGKAVLRDSNAATLKAWRKHVTAQARLQTRYHDTLTGPVKAWVRFTFARPASHYLTDGIRLRAGAPLYPGHGCGDVDKLLRAVFDALTDGEIWGDDTQAVDVRARKFYAGDHELALAKPGVDIVLEPLTPTSTAPVSVVPGPGPLATEAGAGQPLHATDRKED